MLSDNGSLVATTTRNEPVLGRFHQNIAPTQDNNGRLSLYLAVVDALLTRHLLPLLNPTHE